MDEKQRLEQIAAEVIAAFAIHAPPVPIETMLYHPPEGMWETVDVGQLSGSFLSLKNPFSPRISLARMLVRHIAHSDWGQQRNLMDLFRQNADHLQMLARMILMPAEMVNALTLSARNPTTMSLQFEVPEDEARQRLIELIS